MSADINIKKIVNVYYTKTDKWQRDFSAPRLYDGFVLFEEGEIEYRFEDKILVAKKGDFLFLPKNIPYSGKKQSEKLAFYVVDFECFTQEEYGEVIGASVHKADKFDAFCAVFADAVEVWNEQRIEVSLKLKAFIYSVLSSVTASDNRHKTISVTGTILDYIYENIGDASLCVKGLCTTFSISESQLRRNFVKQTGMNPNEFVLKLRINKAKNELAASNKSISEISYECGFSSPYYFSRCFSEQTGVSPSKYRMLT